MRQKKGFTLRTVCGEHVIVAEGLEVINFNKLLSLNESAASFGNRQQPLAISLPSS